MRIREEPCPRLKAAHHPGEEHTEVHDLVGQFVEETQPVLHAATRLEDGTCRGACHEDDAGAEEDRGMLRDVYVGERQTFGILTCLWLQFTTSLQCQDKEEAPKAEEEWSRHKVTYKISAFDRHRGCSYLGGLQF